MHVVLYQEGKEHQGPLQELVNENECVVYAQTPPWEMLGGNTGSYLLFQLLPPHVMCRTW